MSRLIQYWDDSSPPGLMLTRMRCWQDSHPDLRYTRFDRASAADWIGAVYGHRIENDFLQLRLPAMQADVFRVAFLLEWGGVWVDAATHCLAPLSTWLPLHSGLTLLRRPHQQPPAVCNGLMHAGAPGHPLLAAAWQRICEVIAARRSGRVYRLVGPGLFRELLESGRHRDGVIVLPSASLESAIRFGSSSEAVGADQHWSQRQQSESLYLNGGLPSASQRSNEAS